MGRSYWRSTCNNRLLKDEISKVQEGLFPQASIEELYQRSSNLLKEDIEENISYNTQVDETVDEVVNLDSNGMKIKVFLKMDVEWNL